MTSRIQTPYSITWASNVFTATYAATWGVQTISSFDYLLDSISTNYFAFGNNGLVTNFDYRLCTSPIGSSVSDLIAKIKALIGSIVPPNSTITTPNVTSPSITGITTITGTTNINTTGGAITSMGNSNSSISVGGPINSTQPISCPVVNINGAGNGIRLLADQPTFVVLTASAPSVSCLANIPAMSSSDDIVLKTLAQALTNKSISFLTIGGTFYSKLL
jgi:hypothetical protein